mgnify:CR=1 FL=1
MSEDTATSRGCVGLVVPIPMDPSTNNPSVSAVSDVRRGG